MRIAGGWRITEAELWDCDALNLVAPAFIEFTEDGSSGSFGFVAVQGEMDCREVERDGRPGVEFSWEGNDECDPASGRGWAGLGGTARCADASSSTLATTQASRRSAKPGLTRLVDKGRGAWREEFSAGGSRSGASQSTGPT
jgi:hypothetical protein